MAHSAARQEPHQQEPSAVADEQSPTFGEDGLSRKRKVRKREVTGNQCSFCHTRSNQQNWLQFCWHRQRRKNRFPWGNSIASCSSSLFLTRPMTVLQSHFLSRLEKKNPRKPHFGEPSSTHESYNKTDAVKIHGNRRIRLMQGLKLFQGLLDEQLQHRRGIVNGKKTTLSIFPA